MEESFASLSKLYDPQAVEEKWYAWWESQGYFRPLKDLVEDQQGGQPLTAEQREQLAARIEAVKTASSYCITIPPPNVTGSLHMGHALNHSVMDALIRWQRMKGVNTLCVPGTDHAGIATQNVVEKTLRREENLTRHDLGREAFVERVWQWVAQYGNTIVMQLKRLGCSYDWHRLRFTLDKNYAEAVLEVFVRWWNDKLLYLGSRVVNWCPRCNSVISDIEVNSKEHQGSLWHIRYPFADGSGHVIVATTRPETMLGDVAVAVNPEDVRYQGLVGKTLRLPLVGREIPLIADEYPDPNFGSGAVKITPAHDPNDFEVGKRHDLPMPVIMAKDASIDTRALRAELRLSDNAFLDKYQGMDRYEARKLIVQDLEEQGFLEKIEAHSLALGRCDRCDTVIEPLLSEQWFCDMSALSKPAIEAVETGEVTFVPERYTTLYMEWMRNLRDWPISRQLWWGHQIPAYYCVSCHPEDFEKTEDGYEILRRRDPVVSHSAPEKCEKCEQSEFVRDPWVLDTWFSSAIWPQTVLGWPNQSEDLADYYPTNVLTTDRGILYLWVARMIMTGYYFMGKKPFNQVYIHATIQDAQGRRMSKSLGTGIDPLDLIDQYGADATRFALLQQAGMAQDIRFSEQRVEITRNFCNKIWNASRFVMMNLDQEFRTRLYYDRLPDKSKLTTVDRWIISRFQRAVKEVEAGLNTFQIDDASRALYEFIWNEFCDWYIEAVKPRLADEEQKRAPQTVLTYLLERTMRLLHPIMPFLTEEIWQALPHSGDTLSLARFPEYDENWVDEEAEKAIAMLQDVTRAARNLRAEVGITPGQKVSAAFVSPTSEESAAVIQEGAELVRTFAWLGAIHLEKPGAETKRIETTAIGADVYLPIEGVIDTEKECARLRKELEKTQGDLGRVRGKLDNAQFLERAPADVIAKERAVESELAERVVKIGERLSMFGCS